MNLEQLRKLKPEIQALAREYHIDPDSIRVFGSLARGDATGASDIDLLVTLTPDADLLDLAGFNEGTRRLLHMNVDTVADESLHTAMAVSIQADAIPL